jgi:hypothetical protein
VNRHRRSGYGERNKGLDRPVFQGYTTFQRLLKGAKPVKLIQSDMAKRAEQAVRDLLQEVPFLKVTRIESPGRISGAKADLVARVRGPATKRLLIFEIKSSGEPRLARQAANQLAQYLQRYKAGYGVFLAPYVSRKAADVCKAQGIGFLDLSGNCRLCFDRILIEREGRPNRFAEKRDLRTLCSPRASRVLRVLLTGRRVPWRVTQLAQEAQVSLGLVSNVKKLLENREWIQHQRDGFVLTDPRELLAEWSRNYAFRRNESRDYYSAATTSGAESDLAELCSRRGIRYALTAFSAAVRMAPAVRYQRVFAYIGGPVQDVARALGLKEVSSGPNVTLLEPYDSGVFYGARQLDRIWTVSPVQAYLDLVNLKGRGAEAAEALLRETIEPQW